MRWEIDFRSYFCFRYRICHGASVLYPIALWSAVALSLSSYLLKNDTRHRSWKRLGAGRNHWNSNLPGALLQRSLWISDNLPAEPGLCLSWQPRCLRGLSRGSLEVRVQRRSRVRAAKTKASTSCVTHWLILHRERTDIWYFGIWSSLHLSRTPWQKSKTGKKIEQGREFCTFYCHRCYWTPRYGQAHAQAYI